MSERYGVNSVYEHVQTQLNSKRKSKTEVSPPMLFHIVFRVSEPKASELEKL